MAKAKVFQYRIQYIDNTYQIVDWTKAELESVGKAMIDCQRAVIVGNDVYRVEDIRAIVYLPPLPEPTEAEKKAEAGGYIDAQTIEWLKSQGVNIDWGESE